VIKRASSKASVGKKPEPKSAGSKTARAGAPKKPVAGKGGNVSAKKADSGAVKLNGRPSVRRASSAGATPNSKPSQRRSILSSQDTAATKPIKCPLTKKELAFFRDELVSKRATLVGDVAKMTDEALRKSRQNSTGDLSNMPIHMADLGSDNFEQEFTLGLIESEHVILREIDEALARIENGTFGICLGTGKPISKARLRAKPWAKYCIEYAQRLERGY
jgi:DnaK suppressor protein